MRLAIIRSIILSIISIIMIIILFIIGVIISPYITPYITNVPPTTQLDEKLWMDRTVAKKLSAIEYERLRRYVQVMDAMKKVQVDVQKRLSIDPMGNPQEARDQNSKLIVSIENMINVLKEEIRRTTDPSMKEKLSAPLTLLESMKKDRELDLLSMLPLQPDAVGPPLGLEGHAQGEADRFGDIEHLTIKPTPGAVRIAFVNDGKIVLVCADGTSIQTDIRGESPSLSADGRSLAYTRIKLTDRVVPTHPTFPRYGITCKADGMYIWDLISGKQILVDRDGDHPCLSPNGESIVYNQNEVLFVKNLKTDQKQRISRGDNACWFDNGVVLYESDFQVYRYYLNDSRTQEVLKPPGIRLSKNMGEDASRTLLQHVFNGTTVSAQMHLFSFGGSRKAAFAQFEGSLASGQKTILAILDGQRVETVTLLETRDPDFKMEPVNQIAVSPDGKKVAYVRARKTGEIIPQGVAYSSNGTRIGIFSPDIGKSPQFLYVCHRTLGGKIGEHVFLAAYPDVSQLEFWDNDTLLVTTLDTRETMIQIGGGAIYVVGARMLDPDQLRMMDLDTRIARADAIHRIDLNTEQAQVWFSGHAICVAQETPFEMKTR
jgi:hypothetical protein